MIKYLKGDATNPIDTPDKTPVIAHVCNDIGQWGAGFVIALSKKWPEPEQAYRTWAKSSSDDFALGNSILVPVQDENRDIFVMNIIGQHKIRTKDYIPVRYWAIHKAFKTFCESRPSIAYSFHMPRIGCGLAGGLWEEIEYILNDTLIKYGFETYVYYFE